LCRVDKHWESNISVEFPHRVASPYRGPCGAWGAPHPALEMSYRERKAETCGSCATSGPADITSADLPVLRCGRILERRLTEIACSDQSTSSLPSAPPRQLARPPRRHAPLAQPTWNSQARKIILQSIHVPHTKQSLKQENRHRHSPRFSGRHMA